MINPDFDLAELERRVADFGRQFGGTSAMALAGATAFGEEIRLAAEAEKKALHEQIYGEPQ